MTCNEFTALVQTPAKNASHEQWQAARIHCEACPECASLLLLGSLVSYVKDPKRCEQQMELGEKLGDMHRQIELEKN